MTGKNLGTLSASFNHYLREQYSFHRIYGEIRKEADCSSLLAVVPFVGKGCFVCVAVHAGVSHGFLCAPTIG